MAATTLDLAPSSRPCFEVRGSAVVAWECESDSQGPRYLESDPAKRRIVFEAHLDDEAALFRLRIPVRLKHLDETYLYFHVPPDHVSSFAWVADHDAPDRVRQTLSGGVTRLRFLLHTPGQLIVPAQDVLHPKRPATARVIEALKLLATAVAFSVYVEPTVLSKTRLQLLDAAIRSGRSRPPARLQDLRSLYNGRGGRFHVVADEKDVSTASEDAASTVAVDSPPPYEEIGPGPPMPPVDTSEKPLRRRRSQRSSSGSSVGSQARPTKRGVRDASPDRDAKDTETEGRIGGPTPPASHLFADLESLVRRQEEQIQSQQGQIQSQQGQIQSQQEELIRLNTTVVNLECLVATLQGRLDEAEDKAETVDSNNYELQEDLDALRETIPDAEDITKEVLEKIRVEIHEQIEERMGDVLAKMRSALGSYS